MTDVTNAPPYFVSETAPRARLTSPRQRRCSPAPRGHLVIAGGSRWGQETVDRLVGFAERRDLPVAVSFRRQSLFPATHPNYAGDLAVGANAALVAYAKSADVVLLLGTPVRNRQPRLPGYSECLRRGEADPRPSRCRELGRIYRADVAINTSPRSFLSCIRARRAPGRGAPGRRFEEAHALPTLAGRETDKMCPAISTSAKCSLPAPR